MWLEVWAKACGLPLALGDEFKISSCWQPSLPPKLKNGERGGRNGVITSTKSCNDRREPWSPFSRLPGPRPEPRGQPFTIFLKQHMIGFRTNPFSWDYMPPIWRTYTCIHFSNTQLFLRVQTHQMFQEVARRPPREENSKSPPPFQLCSSLSFPIVPDGGVNFTAFKVTALTYTRGRDWIVGFPYLKICSKLDFFSWCQQLGIHTSCF